MSAKPSLFFTKKKGIAVKKKDKKTICILKDIDYISRRIEQSMKRIIFDALHVYVITTIKIPNKWLKENKMKFLAPTERRADGFFFNEEDSIKCIIENGENVSEGGYYNVAIIEETLHGLYPYIENEMWFKWNYKKSAYIMIKKPNVFKNIVNFGIG